MKNNYIIESEDKVVIDSKINKIIEEEKEHIEVIKLNMEDKKINDIIEELNTFDLLSERKAVICYNPLFLEKDDGDNIKNLKKYLENPSSNILILRSSETFSIGITTL